jgi:hypothetical protein
VRYDRIVKLETQASDAAYVIKLRMRGRGLGTARNSNDHEKSTLLGAGKRLRRFETLSDSQMGFLRRRLKPDLDMFGYSFDEDEMVAKCGYDDGCC